MRITLFAVRHGNKVYEFGEPVSLEIRYSAKRWYAHTNILSGLSTWTFAPKRRKILPCFAKQNLITVREIA